MQISQLSIKKLDRSILKRVMSPYSSRTTTSTHKKDALIKPVPPLLVKMRPISKSRKASSSPITVNRPKTSVLQNHLYRFKLNSRNTSP